MSTIKGSATRHGQGSLFDTQASFAEPEPEVTLEPENSCSASVGNGPLGTASSVESPAEETGSQTPNDADEAESEPQQQEGAGPETPTQTTTLDDLMAETESKDPFGETKIEIGMTLMPGDGDRAERMIVGSVGAENCEFLFFSGRGDEVAAIRELEEALARFKRELPRRLKKPTATPKSPAKAAVTSPRKPVRSKK